MKAIKIGVLFPAHVSSLRVFLRKPARWAIVAVTAALSAAAPAQESQMTVTQLGSSACTDGYYFPSIDAAVKKVAFNSFCDLVPGENSDGNSELFVMNVNGSGLKQLTSSVGGLGVINPQISWSGQKIVFASDRDLISGGNTDGNYEIFTINVDGTGLTQLTNTTGGRFVYGFQGNTGPCFDSRAQKIVFSSDRDLIPGGNSDGNNDLFAMNTDGSGLVQLTSTTGGWGLGGGCLNANDTQVILDSDRDLVPGGNADGNYEIFTMKANGTGFVQLTNTNSPASGIGNVSPVWTSDGKTVFFRSDVDWTGGNPDLNQEVFRMKIDGSNKVQMTSSAGGFGSTATGINLNGKVMAVESDADLVPGNNVNHSGTDLHRQVRTVSQGRPGAVTVGGRSEVVQSSEAMGQDIALQDRRARITVNQGPRLQAGASVKLRHATQHWAAATDCAERPSQAKRGLWLSKPCTV